MSRDAATGRYALDTSLGGGPNHRRRHSTTNTLPSLPPFPHQVSRDAATGRYALDTSLGGGPGCSGDNHWEATSWRLIDERAWRVGNRVYLPLGAKNTSIVTVK